MHAALFNKAFLAAVRILQNTPDPGLRKIPGYGIMSKEECNMYHELNFDGFINSWEHCDGSAYHLLDEEKKSYTDSMAAAQYAIKGDGRLAMLML